MLAMPEVGLRPSEKVHNSDFDVFCDWLEASALFFDEPLTKSDVVDCLREKLVYSDPDFARQLVDDAWLVLRGRLTPLADTLDVDVTRQSIRMGADWSELPAYSFCVLLSCMSYLYPKWAATKDRDISTQGDLFERITVEALSQMLPAWSVVRVGWSPTNPVRLKGSIDEITSKLHEVLGSEVDVHVDSHANELGLDVLAYYSFADHHAAIPVLMFQCASGKDWRKKRKTPDLSIWRKVINFNSAPVKGFAMPYSFAEAGSFRKEATSVEGVFLDRNRLLVPNPMAINQVRWASADLNKDLTAWCKPFVDSLPMMDAAA